MRSFPLLLIALFALQAPAAGAGDAKPASLQAVGARVKFDAATAKADQTLAAAQAGVNSVYLADLQRVLDVSMKAANIDDANWAKAEMQRIKSDGPELSQKPRVEIANAARTRYAKANARLQDERRKSLAAAQKQYVLDLQTAKRTALTTLKDLDEANRITAEIDRIKALDYAKPAQRGVDLLKLVDLSTDVVSGKWTVNEGRLTCEKAQPARIEFPYVPPSEYDFRVTFTIVDGTGANNLVCAAGGRQFMWTVSADGNVFNSVDGKLNYNATAKKKAGQLVAGKRYTLTVKVRKGEVEGYLDEALLNGLKTDYSNLSMDPAFALRRGDVLGLCVYENVIAVESAQLIEITGEGKAAR